MEFGKRRREKGSIPDSRKEAPAGIRWGLAGRAYGQRWITAEPSAAGGVQCRVRVKSENWNLMDQFCLDLLQ